MIERIVMVATVLALAGCGRNEPAKLPDRPASSQVSKGSGTAAGPAGRAGPAQAPGRISRFTRLDDSRCGPKQVSDETGDWDRTCRGVDGYALNWSSGDLREDLAIVRGGKTSALGIPVKVANGAFDSIAPTIEWRGPAGAPADVMVIRVKVANDQGEDDGGQLVIVRLDASPCIAAIVRPRSEQSEEARKIADSAPQRCV